MIPFGRFITYRETQPIRVHRIKSLITYYHVFFIPWSRNHHHFSTTSLSIAYLSIDVFTFYLAIIHSIDMATLTPLTFSFSLLLSLSLTHSVSFSTFIIAVPWTINPSVWAIVFYPFLPFSFPSSFILL